MKSYWITLGMFLGRFSIALFFLCAGVIRLLDADFLFVRLAINGWGIWSYFPYVLGGLQIFSSILVLVGWKTRFGASLLLVWVCLSIYLFDSWKTTEWLRQLNSAAGLFYLLLVGPGDWSVDHRKKIFLKEIN